MFTEKKSEDKVDRFGMLIVKGGLIFVVLLLIFCLVITPYVFLCLIRGFELVPVILLTGLIIFVTLVSACLLLDSRSKCRFSVFGFGG